LVGFVLTAAWVLAVLRRHRRSSSLAAAWPAGYRLSAVGLLAFAAGFVGDGVWHSLFGIEADVEALLSPTHLAMFVGGVLLLLTPARRAWALLPTGARLGWGEGAGLLGSVTLATMMVAFFTQFAWALSATVPARPLVPRAGVAEVLLLEELERAYGLAAILLTTLMLLVPAVVLQRRWVLPVGATALVWTATAAGLALYRVGHHPLATVLAAAAAGLVFDLAGRLPGPWGMRVAAAAGPGVLWAAYFAVLATAQGLRWPAELWAGSTVMASLAGVALTAATGRPDDAASVTAVISQPELKPTVAEGPRLEARPG
jgi:hypothetical protein